MLEVVRILFGMENPGRNATFSPRSVIVSLTSGECDQRVRSWPPRLARLSAIAVPHAPLPITAIRLMQRWPSFCRSDIPSREAGGQCFDDASQSESTER